MLIKNKKYIIFKIKIFFKKQLHQNCRTSLWWNTAAVLHWICLRSNSYIILFSSATAFNDYFRKQKFDIFAKRENQREKTNSSLLYLRGEGWFCNLITLKQKPHFRHSNHSSPRCRYQMTQLPSHAYGIITCALTSHLRRTTQLFSLHLITPLGPHN